MTMLAFKQGFYSVERSRKGYLSSSTSFSGAHSLPLVALFRTRNQSWSKKSRYWPL